MSDVRITDIQPVKRGIFANTSALNQVWWNPTDEDRGKLRAHVIRHTGGPVAGTVGDWIQTFQQAVLLHKARCLIIASCIHGEISFSRGPRSEAEQAIFREVIALTDKLGLSELEFYQLVEGTAGVRERLGLTSLRIELE